MPSLGSVVAYCLRLATIWRRSATDSQLLLRWSMRWQFAQTTARSAKLEAVKKEFYDLFALKDPKRRGKLLEGALNRVFEVAGILITEAFVVVGTDGEGVVEQVDGAVEIDGKPFLVEMKWWNAPIGRDPMCSHLVRVYGRGGLAHGIFISYTDYTEPAISVCKDALGRGAVIALCTLAELVRALENRADLKVFFKDKIDAAIVKKMPYMAYP
jgi:restriction system protein